MLSLYAATTESDPDNFIETAMTLVQTVVPFDSAGCSSLDTRSSDVLVLGSDTFRETPTMMKEWKRANAGDPVLARSLAYPGRATTFNSPILVRSLTDEGLIAYLNGQRHHQNGVAIILPDKTPGRWEGAGFYRADHEKQFSRDDISLVELLAPHMLQAARISRRGADLTSMGDEADYAIVNASGAIQFANDAFYELARKEWPEWRSDRLPAAMLDGLRADTSLHFMGQHVRATARKSGEMLIVALKALSVLETLSPRETVVARLFGAGMSAKEIAQQMHISHHTARNFVQRIYKKLNVNDKAALAVMLADLSKMTR